MQGIRNQILKHATARWNRKTQKQKKQNRRPDKDRGEDKDINTQGEINKRDAGEHRASGKIDRGRKWKVKHETWGQNFKIKQEIKNSVHDKQCNGVIIIVIIHTLAFPTLRCQQWNGLLPRILNNLTNRILSEYLTITYNSIERHDSNAVFVL